MPEVRDAWTAVWRRLLTLLALICVAVPALAGADRQPTLRSALASGQPFVLVVSPARPAPALLASEAYGDWAAQLAAFQDRARTTVVVTSTDATYRRLVSRPTFADGFGTLFVRRGGRALVHPGKILDPFLYECGVAFIRDGSLCREAKPAGMRVVQIKRR